MTHRALLRLTMVLAMATIVAGLATAREPIAECHAAVVFPREACYSRSGGWWCDGEPIETRFCYRAEVSK